MATQKDIISLKTRLVFREYMTGWVLREISDEFDAAHIICDEKHVPSVGGERRTLIEKYYHTLDWSNPKDIKKVLQVFEGALHEAEKLAAIDDSTWQRERKNQVEKLTWCLERDGYRWAEGRIVRATGTPVLDDIQAAAETLDARHLAEQIRRIQDSIETDPSLAIGTAKELIETVCKTILEQRGKPVTGSPDIPVLTKDTLRELKLVPEGIDSAAKGSEVIKRLLSNLGTIGQTLAELRGLYGTGHGKHGKASGLSARHAKLAVGAAATLATFLFETHAERTREAKP